MTKTYYINKTLYSVYHIYNEGQDEGNSVWWYSSDPPFSSRQWFVTTSKQCMGCSFWYTPHRLQYRWIPIPLKDQNPKTILANHEIQITIGIQPFTVLNFLLQLNQNQTSNIIFTHLKMYVFLSEFSCQEKNIQYSFVCFLASTQDDWQAKRNNWDSETTQWR